MGSRVRAGSRAFDRRIGTDPWRSYTCALIAGGPTVEEQPRGITPPPAVTVSTIAGVRAFDRGLGRPRGGCLVTCKRLAGRRSVVEEEPRSWGLLFVKYA